MGFAAVEGQPGVELDGLANCGVIQFGHAVRLREREPSLAAPFGAANFHGAECGEMQPKAVFHDAGAITRLHKRHAEILFNGGKNKKTAQLQAKKPLQFKQKSRLRENPRQWREQRPPP